MTGGSGRTAASLAVLLWLPLLFSCVSCIEAAREVPNDHPSITAKSSDLWPQLRDTTSLNASMQLFARSLPAGQCSATEPCVDSSCCANTGYCGLDPAHCGSSVCISNCDAKAECGIGAATPGAQCPLNVCCSQYGYCGTTSDFCGTGCQSNCDQPNPIQLSPPGNIQNIVIGYWEAWSLTTRSCAARTLNDVRTDSITHLNVAFGYITPGTFQIYAIPGADATILGSLANLKQNAPGLKVGHRWLSLGGWSFSDNDTTTQPVFSNIASTAVNRAIFITNLVQFMKEWDFDGVDIDWEYPGAPDRGGQPNDGQNYVYLVRDIQTVFNDLPYDWGLSFTAPTSYWYMRWFEIGDMMQYVNWVNLMTYDLHGSWDSPEDSIGSFVYAHTNLTEIEEALDLLWRNDVPANQVNLGLGFYGRQTLKIYLDNRTYTLSDPSCSAPGCPFSGPGVAGECTGTPGVLSYDEITTYRKMYNPNTVYDQVAAVNYFQYSADQWVSYDDVVSIRAKVSWANNYGLLGLFIWALDLDDSSYSALNSVLAPDGLGKFKSQNGVGSGLTSNWISIVGDQCYFAGCGETCPPITVQTGEPVYCGPEKTQPLCCPINNAPDPAFCQWRAGSVDFVCYDNCRSDEVLIAQSSWPIVNGEPKFCLAGQGDYCCALEESGPQLCGWSDTCVSIDPHSGIPTATGACPAGRNFVTYGKQNCDINSNSWAAFCCDAEVNTKSCSWGGADPYDCSSSCGPNQVEVAEDMQGGGAVCGSIDPDTAVVTYPESLCCNAAALRFSTVNLPVPLDYLFPSPGPSTDTQKIDLEIDQTPYGTSSQDPNENAFGFMIVSGPASDVANLNKREGSHWELYDCPSEHHEEQQTAKAICINDGPESTCGDLWLGGIPGKVMEMPPGCGPGKYAIAVSFEPAENQDQNNQQIPRHIRRGLAGKTIYDFTFDYDWKRAQKRVSSSTLLRIDYSDDKGYWDSVIASPATLRQKRDLEVEQEHGGDYKRWLEHTWRTERRSMNRDELHARWFSADIVQWFDRQGAVSLDVVGLHHRVQTTYTWWLFDFQRSCSVYDVAISSRFRMWADLNIDVSASIGVTLIGHLADLHSWDESHVWFRSMGSVDTVLHFDAYAQLSFETGQVELFGLENFGANFRIPGLVTIGPNIQVVGSLAGQASIHASAQVEMKIADWDITQRYPSADTPSLENRPVSNALPVDGYGQQTPDISWDISADGEIVAHVIPKVVLGIVWDTDFLGDCSIELGVDNSMRLTGYASISSTEDPKWCYSADGAAQIYAQVNAPNMFGANYQFYWTLNTYPYQLIYPVCNVPEEPPSPN